MITCLGIPVSSLTFRQAEEFLLSRQQFTWKLGLDRMARIMEEFGNPQTRFPCVHIAGTNGKGSVTAMLESICRQSGLKTGMYTSPHLVSVLERIQVGGRVMSKEDFAQLVNRLRPAIERLGCTFFEAMTAIAFLFFATAKIDVAFLEVGLGGRLDATNIVTPLVSVITDISFDHTEHLGDSLAKIAAEKAGIIKQGVPCVIGQLPRSAEGVISNACLVNSSPLYRSRQQCRIHDLKMQATGSQFNANGDGFMRARVELALAGPHQVKNACAAICTAQLLRDQGIDLNEAAIVRGLKQVRWPGRFETVSLDPHVIVDVAHNAAAMQRLCWMLRSFYPDSVTTFILGVLKDKDYRRMIASMRNVAARILAVQAQTPKSLDARSIADESEKQRVPHRSFASVAEAVEFAVKTCPQRGLVCITGSHYVVGEAMQKIKSLTS